MDRAARIEEILRLVPPPAESLMQARRNLEGMNGEQIDALYALALQTSQVAGTLTQKKTASPAEDKALLGASAEKLVAALDTILKR